MKCADILLKCNPQYIAISHYGIIKVNKGLLRKFREFVSDYKSVIADIVALQEPNFGLDPNWICFKPIRIHANPGEKISTKLVVRNYLNSQIEFEFDLNLPENWKATPKSDSYLINANTFQSIPISISIPKNANPNGRTIMTANIKWNGKDLGPFPDLMVDHGYTPSEAWKAWLPGKESNLFLWIFNRIKSSKKYFR